jgi:uncharacterized membrane protein
MGSRGIIPGKGLPTFSGKHADMSSNPAMSPETRLASRSTSRYTASGYLLGLSMAGFFDGILLHQILQWHHLLSLVSNPAARDIRVQILADGLFHALMYVIAAAGMWLLWTSRQELSAPQGGRRLLGAGLSGFGLWHLLDAGLFHWILGIHRVRVDVDNPLFWDLLWFAVFGLAFIVAGRIVRAKAGPGDPPRTGRGAATAAMIASIVTGAGLLAALPPPASNTAVVLFRPGIASNEIFHAIDAVGGRVLWADGSGSVWAINLADPTMAPRLYRHGALMVSRSAVSLGCLSWLKA